MRPLAFSLATSFLRTGNKMKPFKMKTEDGQEFNIEFPPVITKEILDKLAKTAEYLYAITEMWNIPDISMGALDIDDFDPFAKDIDSNEKVYRAFIFNWYQTQPFIPLFFNKSYYEVMKAKIIELGVKKDGVF
jgi:hypothetical protein